MQKESLVNTVENVVQSAIGRATLGDQLRRNAQHLGDKLAFVAYEGLDVRRELSYKELDRQSNRFARALEQAGIKRGDRMAVMMTNHIVTPIAYYGALKLGVSYTGINVLFGEEEVEQQLQHLEPQVIVAGAAFIAKIDGSDQAQKTVRIVVEDSAATGEWLPFTSFVEDLPDDDFIGDVTEDDLAMIVYTSGTEASPKGVMISHRNYLISTVPAWGRGLRVSEEDTWLYVMPFYTIAGIGSMTSLTQYGATLVLPSDTDPETSLEIISRERVSVIAQTPTFFIGLANHPRFGSDTVGTVERCNTYGGQVSPWAIDAWSSAAPGVVWGTYWGQSELTQLGTVGWFTSLNDVPDNDPTWIGRPVSHLEVRIVDANGDDAEEGELWCRTPSTMVGYYKDPEKTRTAFLDGWVRTGDIMRTDEFGNLFFRDRTKDMIKTGGMNVSSQEVERRLQQHPDVSRAAVVGLQDDYWVEAVTGFVVLKEGSTTTTDELRAFCKESLAGYKVPKTVRLVDQLPTDPQGKLLKRELRRMHKTG